MNIDTDGSMKSVIFWPADEISAAFERLNAATGKPEETQEMRLFIRAMNYFYERSSVTSYSIGDEEIAEIYRLAGVGMSKELDMESPKRETA